MSIMTKVSREEREYCQGSRERGESLRLNVESMEKGDHDSNQVPLGPGDMSGK